MKKNDTKRNREAAITGGGRPEQIQRLKVIRKAILPTVRRAEAAATINAYPGFMAASMVGLLREIAVHYSAYRARGDGEGARGGRPGDRGQWRRSRRARCSARHGKHGGRPPRRCIPRLAGPDSDYLVRQLDAFARGSRDNETMAPIAKALSADERQAVAKFYAGLTAPPRSRNLIKHDDNIIAIGANFSEPRRLAEGIAGLWSNVMAPPDRASERRSPN